MLFKKTSSSSRNLLTVLALALFIVALSLVILTSLNPAKKMNIFGGGFADGYKAARVQAIKLSPQLSMNQGGMNIATAKVTAVSDNSITVETNFFVDERVDGVGNTRKVTLAKDGKVQIRTQKDSSVFAEENKNFQAKINSFKISEKLPTPPPPYETKEGKLSEIAVGDMVTIQSDSDIHLAPEISAKEIDASRMTQ
ncbi:MAG: hypothetical protein WC477_01150 [Patescibacteria group bacterium]